MGYITDKDKMRYKSLKDLEPVELVFKESDEAIRTKTRTLDDSDIFKILCVSAIVPGGGIFALWHIANQARKLKQAKEICYTTALQKQNAIIEELRKERNADKKRIEYLTALNNSLNGIIADLTHDLGY